MPPKAKFEKDHIINIALQIVRKNGFEALTARLLAEKLGSSARPIFTVFQGMEEIKDAVMNSARQLYNSYVIDGLSSREYEHSFKGVGIKYISFACNEPKLFQILFMSEQENSPTIKGILPLIDGNYQAILDSIQQDYNFDANQALRLYQHLWVYTHGIAVLCATKMCSFTAEDISNMLTEVCGSIIKNWKGDKNDSNSEY